MLSDFYKPINPEYKKRLLSILDYFRWSFLSAKKQQQQKKG